VQSFLVLFLFARGGVVLASAVPSIAYNANIPLHSVALIAPTSFCALRVFGRGLHACRILSPQRKGIQRNISIACDVWDCGSGTTLTLEQIEK